MIGAVTENDFLAELTGLNNQVIVQCTLVFATSESDPLLLVGTHQRDTTLPFPSTTSHVILQQTL